MSDLNKIFLVVPRLIEQPTWGGKYILETKDWTGKKLFKDLKIGQSYEIFSGSNLRQDIDSSDHVSFTGELGYAMEPDKFFYEGDKNKLIPLKKIIENNPLAVLGARAFKKFGKDFKILIKFTQAKGNSFQLHVRQKDSGQKWQSKPESWYYFEPGLLTLGVKKGINWDKYKICCLRIEEEMKILGHQIYDKKLTPLQAKTKAKQILKKNNPWQYVNLVKTKKDELIDLSGNGLHHSWEEDKQEYPLGNVLYELCQDVMDPISTIRCFDQGKLDKDGTLRKLDIEDYFTYIDRTEKTNNPQNHKLKPKLLLNQEGVAITSLLATKYYSLDRIVLGKTQYQGKHTSLEDSFHHLFVKQGKVNVLYNQSRLELTQGHSCFIQCSIKNYCLESKSSHKTEILKTFIN